MGCFGFLIELIVVAVICAVMYKIDPTVSVIIFLLIGILTVALVLVKVFRDRAVRKAGMDRVDSMTGEEFERWCGALLGKAGFRNVRYTKKTGDHGVDIVAVKDGVRYAVQCKRYDGSVDNSAVQEVVAGLAIYKCRSGLVMTNSTFTGGAVKLARANGVGLWDRKELERMIAKTAKKKSKPLPPDRNEWDDLLDAVTILEDDDSWI